jgi:histidinol-phosphate aminotransferase
MALGVQAVVAERRRVAAALASRPGTRPFPSDANFVLFRAQEGAERLWRSLVRQGVLVRNLHGPGLLENCLRVTIGTADENDAFLQAMDVGGQARPCAGETAPDG